MRYLSTNSGVSRVAKRNRFQCQETVMKALVYHGPGKKALDERPKPDVATQTDAIVKIVKTTICGTDLHILKGDVPTCAPGRILGHRRCR
jgi:threonine dehydrogenase-like Zn-dependent dehydrogenase